MGSPVTRIASVATLPSWYPWAETETKPAPMPLLRIQAFVNTVDAEKGIDLLDDQPAARAWFTEAGMLSPGAELTATELEQAKEVRECLRELLTGSNGSDVSALRELAGSRSARLTIEADGRVALENPGRSGIVDGLFELLLIMRRAQEDGTWSRLRICANDECRWAFYDRSRNQQGSWCDMATCGNRLKNRELRARKRR